MSYIRICLQAAKCLLPIFLVRFSLYKVLASLFIFEFEVYNKGAFSNSRLSFVVLHSVIRLNRKHHCLPTTFAYHHFCRLQSPTLLRSNSQHWIISGHKAECLRSRTDITLRSIRNDISNRFTVQKNYHRICIVCVHKTA